eukprot:TRINITY_DN9636_c0_g1_i8.p1 TRINITY_DN9636_c0_g1~~TRINITY_DN9636_c0_g1_i8.p1  ORF type:complete len:578 (+),score=41.71 TRINITY_DN9636_c0_g1_i8:3-1736(+)
MKVESMMMKIFFLLVLMSPAAYGFGGKPDFFEPVPASRSQPMCCQDNHVLSCDQFKLNTSLLGTDDQLYLSPLNVTLDYLGLVGESDHTYHYGSALHHVDFIVTHNVNTGGVYGHAVFTGAGEYRSFVIEYCGNLLHALKEIDVDNLEDNSTVDYEDHEEYSDSNPTANSDISQADPQTRWSCWWMCPPEDTTTIVTYTVKVYYTPRFETYTPDISGFVDQVIAETNQGYINSQVPLRLKLHCIEKATIEDTSSSHVTIEKFSKMKGTSDALRGTADTAVLLAFDFADVQTCGIAYQNTISSKMTYAVVRKDCALGHYSFGHELGHTIGLMHNREALGGWGFYFSDYYGYLIAKGNSTNKNGFRTIMAYNKDGEKRMNYYSNPNVILPETGTQTGVAGVANSARTLSVNRFALAAVGDESGGCGCQIKGKSLIFESKKKGWIFEGAAACKNHCKIDPKCIAWNDYAVNCYNLVAKERWAGDKNSYGPNYAYENCALSQRDDSCSKENMAISENINSLGSVNAIDAMDCHEKCKENAKCLYYEFSRESNNCYLYKMGCFEFEPTFLGGVTSGVKGGKD